MFNPDISEIPDATLPSEAISETCFLRFAQDLTFDVSLNPPRDRFHNAINTLTTAPASSLPMNQTQNIRSAAKELIGYYTNFTDTHGIFHNDIKGFGAASTLPPFLVKRDKVSKKVVNYVTKMDARPSLLRISLHLKAWRSKQEKSTN